MDDKYTEFKEAVASIQRDGGYVAVAPGNVVAVTRGSNSRLFPEVKFDHEAGMPADLESVINFASDNGVTVINISRANENDREAILTATAMIGLPDPRNLEDVAFLANAVKEAGGTATNVPTTD